MSKYNAKPTTIDGIRFDSKAEARRYDELKLLLAAGEITDLKTHPRFEIWRKNASVIHYEADFSYFDPAYGENVVEDVKGVKTSVYRLKRKMFLAMYPDIKFVEVTK